MNLGLKTMLVSIPIAFISMTSCNKMETTHKSNLMLTMHDTAGNYANVFVEIIDAEVLVDSTNNQSGWVGLNINPGVYDLLELQNGVDTILANNTVLPSGNLSQLRLILGENNHLVLVDSGDTVALSTPSAQQSGLKVQINESLQPNTVYYLVIDFDVHHSIVEQGNGDYSLKPVIKIDSLIEL